MLCQCECGKEKVFYLANIIPKPNARYTKSCGCKRGGLVGDIFRTHGMSGGKFYQHWRSLHDRMRPNYINADSYIGIKVCKRWNKFENFKDDMYESYQAHLALHGGRETTLDRKEVLGNYEPSNCRWATQLEQARNKKTTIWADYKGEKVALIELCERLGLNYSCTYGRIRRGYSLEEALNNKPWQHKKII